MPLMQERIIKLSQIDGSANWKNIPTNSSVVGAGDGDNFFLMMSYHS